MARSFPSVWRTYRNSRWNACKCAKRGEECVRAAVGLTGHWLQLEALVTSDPPCPGLPACLLQQEGCSICPALLLLICITGAHPTFLQANLVRCYSYVYPTTLLFGAGAKVTLLLKLIEHLSSQSLPHQIQFVSKGCMHLYQLHVFLSESGLSDL